MVGQRLDHLRDCGALLSDRDVDADDVAALLVDNRVERNCRLAGLAIADDQLALSTADRDHGVDSLDTGLQRLFHGLPVDDAGSQSFGRIELIGEDGAPVIDGAAERIDDSSDQRLAYGYRHDAAGAAD